MTSSSAWRPSNARETAAARRVSPGRRCSFSAPGADTRSVVDVRGRPGPDRPDVFALVVLDLDHPVRATEDGVVPLGEADLPRDRLEPAEVLELLREYECFRRAVGPLDGGRECVDHGRAGHEAPGGRGPHLAL